MKHGTHYLKILWRRHGQYLSNAFKKYDAGAVDLFSFMSMLANQAILEKILPPGND